MGIFDKIAGFFEDIFGAIGDALSWLLGVPDADDYAGQLINKNSNVANLPVVYGRRLIGGTRVFVSTGGNNKNEYMYIVLALSEGEIQAINSVYVNDKLMVGTPVSGKPYRKVTGGDYKDIIWYQTFTGTDDQTACTTLFNDIGSGPDDFWGVNHRLRGVAHIAMVVKYHQDKGMTSIPEIRCEIQGRKVYDPRTETTVWTSNPALCLRDYLTNERFGKGLPDSAIDDEAFGAAATFCDSTVSSYTGGPSINTFSLNMILDTGNTLFDNTKRFLLAMRGIMPYSEGKYSLIIDKDDASVGTIDESICTRDITIKSVNKNTKLNQVKAVFVNPYKRYEQDSVIWPPADSLEESTFLAEDNNQVLSKDLTLDTVTNFYQARELARVAVLASRSSSIICELVCTSEALKYAVGDIITLEQPSMGWVGPAAKEFRILSIQLAVSGEVGLTLQEYDSSIYPWVTGSEQDDQPETTLPNPNSVDAITTASVTTGSQVLNDGTIQYFADLTWTPPSDELIQDYVVKINKKVGSVTTENVETITTINNKARYILTDTNAQYGYSIQARNGAQVTSEPFTVAPVAVVTDTTAPAPIASGTISAVEGLEVIAISWTNPTDPDFDLVNIKVSDTTTEPTEVFAQVRSNTFVHEVNEYNKTKYYWLATVDTSGNVSAYTSAGPFSTGQPDYNDLLNPPTIPTIPDIAGTFYISLSDSDAPTDTEFNTAVGRNPLENDFVIVSYPDGTGTSTKGYNYTGDPLAWAEVTEYIDGSMIVTGSLSASDITTGTLNANDVTISNLTVSYSSQVTDKPTIPSSTSQLTNDSGFIDDTNVVFSDDLGDYIRLDSVENLLLSFDKYADQETNIDWTGYDDATDDIKVVKSSDAVTGGSYLEIGNNSGNDEAWLIHNKNIPFDPSQTYRVTVRAKQTAGAGSAYFGFAGVASDGTTLVNHQGNNTHSSQHYFAASNTDIPNAWTEYVGYVKGVSTTGTVVRKADYNDPAVMHEDTRFVRPLILVNYSNQAGITLIDSFKIEAISANPNAIQGNEVNANVTNISGGVIQAGSQITVGTGDNIGALSGTDSTFRIWAGNATASSAPFRVSQAGVMYSTGAIIEGNITANSLDVENATVTGTFVAPIGWSNNVYTGVINRGNLNESVKDLIDERIAEVTGGISGDFGQDDGSFSHIAQGNPDPTDPIVLNITHETGKNLTVELSGSRSWNREFIGLPDTDMGVSITLERSPAGANTWTNLTTLTDTGSSITTTGPTIVHTSTYRYSISIYHVLTDDQASGNYDYRARTTVAGSAYNVSIPLQLTVVEPATVGAGNADTLDNQDGTYYLDYNNFTNTPDLSLKADLAGDTFTGDVTFNTHVKLPQNPVGTTYGNGISTIPTSMITQVVGDNDGWRLYGEAGVTNDVKMIFEIVDDIESGDTWVFRNKKTYGDYSATEPFKIQGNGNIIATGTITASGYNNSNWDTAYTYSQVGHLPLTGGTLTGDLNFSAQANRAIKIDTTVADDTTRDAIELFENYGKATGRQAISWWNDNQEYYKARLWTEVGASYNNTKFGIDVADNARVVATRLYFDNGDAVFTKKVTATDLAIESGSSNSIRIGDGFGSGGSATIHNHNQVLYLQYNNGQANTNLYVGGGGTTCNLDATGNLIGAGYLAVGGASVTNIATGGIRSAGKIDTTDITTGSFRVYDGSTFRGGFGTARWALGTSYSVDDMAMYSVGDMAYITTDDGIERALFQANDIRFDGGKVRVGNPSGLSGRSGIRIDSSETDPADLLFGTNKTSTGWTNVHWAISSRGTAEGSALKIYRASGHVSPYNSEFVMMEFNKNGQVAIDNNLDVANYINVGSGGLTVDAPAKMWTGYYSETRRNNNYGVFNTNNHASVFVGSNMWLNSDHSLYTSSTHPTIGGSGIVFAGNGVDDGEGTINFFANGTQSVTSGAVAKTQSAWVAQFSETRLTSKVDVQIRDSKSLFLSAESGGYINIDARDSGNGARIHKYNKHSNDSTYLNYYENWYDGNSYHSIGVKDNQFEMGDDLKIFGKLTVTDYAPAIEFTNTQEVIFEHTGNSTPVPFDMRKGGTVNSDGNNYGTLHLSRVNHTSTATGVGSNLYFRLKDSNGVLREYAGIGGIKEGNTTGRLDFYTYGRDIDMRLTSSGSLQVSGNVTAYSDPSDRRLKTNIENIPNALDKVSKLNGVTFNYRKDGGRSTGLIAQELLEVLPEVVYTTNDIDNPDEEFYAVNYGNTVGLLVEAIKELKLEIEELKNGTNKS